MAALLVIAACTLTLALLIRPAWEGMLRSEIEASLQQKTLLLAARVAASPKDALPQIVQQAAKAAGARVTVIDSSGQVLADSEADPEKMENHATRPEFVAALHGGVGSSTRRSRTVGIDLLYVAAPVPDGAVRMAYPLSLLHEANTQVVRDLVKSGAVAVLLAMLLALIAAQVIGRRLVRITAFAERIAAGDLSARIQEDSSDEIAHVATALDKTARKLEDGFHALETSRQTLETLLNSMQEAVDRRFAGWARAVGEPAHGTPAAERSTHGEQPPVQSVRDPEVLRALETALATRDITTAHAAKIFSGRIFDVTAAPMPGGGAVAVMHDQTEIERVEKTRRDFIANVSHELRTPLTSIQGYSETLLGQPHRAGDTVREFWKSFARTPPAWRASPKTCWCWRGWNRESRTSTFSRATPRELLEDAVATFRDVAALREVDLSLMNTASSPVSVDRRRDTPGAHQPDRQRDEVRWHRRKDPGGRL